jgi:protein-tyrosine kinase
MARRRDNAVKSLMITKFEPLDYACNEALNTLCTNISFAGDKIRKILVTSCQASEGKSFLTMNMMRSFTGLGKQVVFVSGDLRRSAVAERYGLRMPAGGSPGITHYLAGMCDLSDVLYATNIPGAFMVPVGRDVTNSLSLLSSDRLPLLLDKLAEMFDLVLIDAPPVGIIIDAAEIARSCDGTVLVVSYNRVRRRELIETKRQIELTGCPVVGVVLNQVSFESYTNKRYYNRSYYSNYNTRNP